MNKGQNIHSFIHATTAQTHTSLPWEWTPYFAFFNRHPRQLKNIRRLLNKDDINKLNTLEQRVNTLASKLGDTDCDDDNSEWNASMTELPFESIIDNADQEELDHSNYNQMQQTMASNPSSNSIMERSISPAKTIYEQCCTQFSFGQLRSAQLQFVQLSSTPRGVRSAQLWVQAELS